MSRLSRWIPHNHPQHSTPLPSLSPLFTRPSIRQPFLFKSLSKSAGIGTSQPCDRRRNKSSCSSSTTTATTTTPSPASLRFWTSRQAWKRASLNTFRCLVGCSLGDFSTLWLLQVYSPDLGVGNIMACSMAAGLSTSLLLETVLLHIGKDRLPWPLAARTAAAMSFVSMLAMESVQNAVDYHLTGGAVVLSDPQFWLAAGVSLAAGFLAPLPYNYLRLRKYGKACH